MGATHLQMFTHDLKYLYIPEYDGDNLNQKPAKIIIDNEATICIAKFIKDQQGTYILQDTFIM